MCFKASYFYVAKTNWFLRLSLPSEFPVTFYDGFFCLECDVTEQEPLELRDSIYIKLKSAAGKDAKSNDQCAFEWGLLNGAPTF